MQERVVEIAVEESVLGALLVAATRRGVCWLRFGDDARALVTRAREQLRWAELAPGAERLRGYTRDLAACAAGHALAREIPLDVRGSRFQERVWAGLREIPHGMTRSYAGVARAIGQPRAARAVARACASNPVPLLVPCHRVVRSDGSAGGYLGGSERKAALLRAETALAAAAGPAYSVATTPAATSAARSASTRARLTPPSP